MMRFVDKDKKNARPPGGPAEVRGSNAEMEDIMRRLHPEMRRPKPGPDAIAAALEAAQRLAAESDAEEAIDDLEREGSGDAASVACSVCGYRNRQGTKFCGMCGVLVTEDAGAGRQGSQALVRSPNTFQPEAMAAPPRSTGNETHHYHHHYHHHYFPGAHEGTLPRGAVDPAREDKLRPTAAMRGEMSRAEAAVRRVTQEWVLACNTKHLDDLLELYASDPIVLRSNYPPIRGAAAVREYFFGALDAGFGEVEVEPLRVDIIGDLAYEAGRCKALAPTTVGKRREERGKYLWVCHRQANGEWKLVADCWSSDLTLSNLESDIPQGAAVKMSQPRKGS
jgi:ketosteroid isomerase-like protein